ncbi:AraC family transcriptional regulator [Caballeronia sp. LZ008]|uniref:AraC family transcriptional regulator n=1 Tax=unclassified Caballeronia TaxID=2646786 RepID=UPI00202820A8|nr:MULTISPECIES: AraC family transcriptional regulator [unclassified Caballeronia]MDR5794535.1 AraC family transcriptional regulator [Caballeronia sp. LZ008]
MSEKSYETRLARVVAYIHDHLDDALDLNRLAEVACLSPYHWHRIYHAFYGETAAATVRRLRLHRASNELLQGALPIDSIAEHAGYSSVQAFSRAFQASYRIPPAQFRSEGGASRFVPLDEVRSGDTAMHQVDIRSQRGFTVAAMEHCGSYMNIGRGFEMLFHWLAVRGLVDPRARSLGIYFDDPSAVAEDDLRSMACCELFSPDDVKFEAPVSRVEVAGGEFAVLTHIGPYAQLCFAYQWLYGEWLPRSGRETGEAPVFEVYVNDPRETAPGDLVTEIWLSLRQSA